MVDSGVGVLMPELAIELPPPPEVLTWKVLEGAVTTGEDDLLVPVLVLELGVLVEDEKLLDALGSVTSPRFLRRKLLPPPELVVVFPVLTFPAPVC